VSIILNERRLLWALAAATKKVAFQQFPGRLQLSELVSVIAQSKEFDCSSKLTAKTDGS
jgi:hypothetical protein